MTDNNPYLFDVPPTYMGNFTKMIPLFREFNGQTPTNMGGKYPYKQYVMYHPPSPGGDYQSYCSSCSCEGQIEHLAKEHQRVLYISQFQMNRYYCFIAAVKRTHFASRYIRGRIYFILYFMRDSYHN